MRQTTTIIPGSPEYRRIMRKQLPRGGRPLAFRGRPNRRCHKMAAMREKKNVAGVVSLFAKLWALEEVKDAFGAEVRRMFNLAGRGGG